jgi:hypothetical protein
VVGAEVTIELGVTVEVAVTMDVAVPVDVAVTGVGALVLGSNATVTGLADDFRGLVVVRRTTRAAFLGTALRAPRLVVAEAAPTCVSGSATTNSAVANATSIATRR